MKEGKIRMNVRGTLTRMEPGAQMIFTPDQVLLKYLRCICSELKEIGLVYSVNKEDGVYRVTRIS